MRQFGLDTLPCAKSGVGQEHKNCIEERERIRCCGAMIFGKKLMPAFGAMNARV